MCRNKAITRLNCYLKAWYRATSSASVTAQATSQMTGTAHSNIGSIDVTVTLTWTVSNTPKQIDNTAKEIVYVGSTGTTKEIGTVSGDTNLFYECTLTNVQPAAGATDQQIAALKNHSFSGTAQIWTTSTGTESQRFAIHSSKVNSNYLANEDVTISWSIGSDGSFSAGANVKIYVCVGGGTITWGAKSDGTRPFSSLADVDDNATAPAGYLGLVGITQTA